MAAPILGKRHLPEFEINFNNEDTKFPRLELNPYAAIQAAVIQANDKAKIPELFGRIAATSAKCASIMHKIKQATNLLDQIKNRDTSDKDREMALDTLFFVIEKDPRLDELLTAETAPLQTHNWVKAQLAAVKECDVELDVVEAAVVSASASASSSAAAGPQIQEQQASVQIDFASMSDADLRAFYDQQISADAICQQEADALWKVFERANLKDPQVAYQQFIKDGQALEIRKQKIRSAMSAVNVEIIRRNPLASAMANLSIVDLHILFAKKTMDCRVIRVDELNASLVELALSRLNDELDEITAELRRRNHDAPVVGAPLDTVPMDLG